jgi:sugar lactone lactonase YvrE
MMTSRKSPVIYTFFLAAISAFLLSGAALGAPIQVLDPQYQLLISIKNSALPGCNGATIGRDGALYVVHGTAGTISRIDLKTMRAATFVPPHAGVFNPDDITADEKGNFYVTGTTPLVGEVYRLDKKGMKTVIARGFKGPNGIQYNPLTGRLFLTECFWGNRIWELDPTGVREPRIIVPENVIAVPEGFGFDPNTQDLIVPDLGSGKILRVDPDTGHITTILEGLWMPVALKVGPDQKAYFPELLSGDIYRMTLDGQKKEKLAQLPPGLDNLAITGDGRLFVTSSWDATIYQVFTDGSGEYRVLFPKGPNQIGGMLAKGGEILVSDSVMIYQGIAGKYVKTRLSVGAVAGMPMPCGLAEGPGEEIFWTDWMGNTVAMGSPFTGEHKRVAEQLDRPVAALMNQEGTKLFVAEYGSGQITEIQVPDGAKRVLASGLEGPLALAIVKDRLYVAEAKAGRISKVDPDSGKQEVFLAGMVGRPAALGNDGGGNLLVLDGAGQKLYRIGTQDLRISLLAANLPIRCVLTGTYPALELPWPMSISKEGNIYLATADRGVIMLEKVKRMRPSKGRSGPSKRD